MIPDIRFHGLYQFARAAFGIAVIQIQAEVAQREEGRRLLEKMLGQHVDQRLVAHDRLQAFAHRHAEALDFPNVCDIAEHPRHQLFAQVFRVLHVVQKQRVVDAVEDVHEPHGLLHQRDEGFQRLPVPRELVGEHLLVGQDALLRIKADPRVAHADGHAAFDKGDIQAQLPQHGKQHARIFHGADAGVKHISMMAEGPHQAAQTILLLAQQHALPRAAQISCGGQSGHAAARHDHVIRHCRTSTAS